MGQVTIGSLIGRRIYLDTNVLIYATERNPKFVGVLDSVFELIDSGAIAAFTSLLTLPECLVKPFSGRNLAVQNAVKQAQDAVASVAIDLNESVNGFFTDSSRHLGSHTNAYLLALGKRLGPLAGDEGAVLSALREIENALRSGAYL